jgi:hypothetical protein
MMIFILMTMKRNIFNLDQTKVIRDLRRVSIVFYFNHFNRGGGGGDD